MAKRVEVYFMVNEKELDFVTAFSNSLNVPKWEIVSRAIRYFDHAFGELTCKEIFDRFKSKDTAVIRKCRLYLTVPEEDYELLKKHSTELHVSFGEIVRVALLYYASMEFIIPTINTFEEVFIDE